MSILGVYMTVLVCRWKTLKSWKVAKVGNPVRRVLFEQSQRAQLKSVWTSEWSPCLKAKSGYFVAALCFAMERRLELVLIVWRTSVITRKPILSFNRSSNFSKPPILFAAGQVQIIVDSKPFAMRKEIQVALVFVRFSFRPCTSTPPLSHI